jgi:5-dehydro-2-deoxygluconokinase
VEKPGSRPLDLEPFNLAEWPITHTVKCLCFYHPDDKEELKARQERELLRVSEAARAAGRELLIEIIAGKHGPLAEGTVAAVLSRLYELGIKPDWWKLEAQTSAAAWRAIEKTVEMYDPYCRGIVMLGLEAPESELAAAFRVASSTTLVKGFAVGRTIFADAADKWLAGKMTDEGAVVDMAARFKSLVSVWKETRHVQTARQTAR